MFWTKLKQFVYQKRYWLALIGVVVLVLLIAPHFAQAQSDNIQPLPEKTSTTISQVLATVVGIVVGLLVRLFGALVMVEIDVLLYFAQWNYFIDASAVQIGWVVMRDICNMFFVVILLVIALSTILNVETYNYKKLLPKVIILAILINFSKTICGLAIDASQVVMLTFVNGFTAIGPGNIVNATGLPKVLSFSNFKIPADGAVAIDAGAAATSYILALIFIIIVCIVLLVNIVILAFRIVMLWILVILSPVFFFFLSFPSGQSYAKQWSGEFVKYLISGPLLAFFLWISLSVFGNIDADLSAGSTGNKPFPAAEAPLDETSATATPTKAGTWDFSARFVMSIVLLVGGLTMTGQLGVAGGALASGAVGKIKGAGAAPFKRAADLATKGVGWTAKKGFGAATYFPKQWGKRIGYTYGGKALGALGRVPLVGGFATKGRHALEAMRHADEEKATKNSRYMNEDEADRLIKGADTGTEANRQLRQQAVRWKIKNGKDFGSTHDERVENRTKLLIEAQKMSRHSMTRNGKDQYDDTEFGKEIKEFMNDSAGMLGDEYTGANPVYEEYNRKKEAEASSKYKQPVRSHHYEDTFDDAGNLLPNNLVVHIARNLPDSQKQKLDDNAITHAVVDVFSTGADGERKKTKSVANILDKGTPDAQRKVRQILDDTSKLPNLMSYDPTPKPLDYGEARGDTRSAGKTGAAREFGLTGNSYKFRKPTSNLDNLRNKTADILDKFSVTALRENIPAAASTLRQKATDLRAKIPTMENVKDKAATLRQKATDLRAKIPTMENVKDKAADLRDKAKTKVAGLYHKTTAAAAGMVEKIPTSKKEMRDAAGALYEKLPSLRTYATAEEQELKQPVYGLGNIKEGELNLDTIKRGKLFAKFSDLDIEPEFAGKNLTGAAKDDTVKKIGAHLKTQGIGDKLVEQIEGELNKLSFINLGNLEAGSSADRSEIQKITNERKQVWDSMSPEERAEKMKERYPGASEEEAREKWISPASAFAQNRAKIQKTTGAHEALHARVDDNISDFEKKQVWESMSDKDRAKNTEKIKEYYPEADGQEVRNEWLVHALTNETKHGDGRVTFPESAKEAMNKILAEKNKENANVPGEVSDFVAHLEKVRPVYEEKAAEQVVEKIKTDEPNEPEAAPTTANLIKAFQDVGGSISASLGEFMSEFRTVGTDFSKALAETAKSFSGVTTGLQTLGESLKASPKDKDVYAVGSGPFGKQSSADSDKLLKAIKAQTLELRKNTSQKAATIEQANITKAEGSKTEGEKTENKEEDKSNEPKQ